MLSVRQSSPTGPEAEPWGQAVGTLVAWIAPRCLVILLGGFKRRDPVGG